MTSASSDDATPLSFPTDNNNSSNNSNSDESFVIVGDINSGTENPTTPPASQRATTSIANFTPEAVIATTGTSENFTQLSCFPSAVPDPSTPNEIRNHTEQHRHHQQQQSSPIPPVAPAVLLPQREGSSNSASVSNSNYSYPVATFVTNFVRSVSENVRAEIRDHILPTSCNSYPQLAQRYSQQHDINGTSNSDNNDNDNDIATAAITNSNIEANDSTNEGFTTEGGTNACSRKVVPVNEASQSSRMAASNFENVNQIWSLIDGELVARIDSNEDYEDYENDAEGDDDKSRSIGDISFDGCENTQQHDHHYYKSSRMQRGVRKIKKWRNFLNGRGGQKRKYDKNKKTKSDGTQIRRDEAYSDRDDPLDQYRNSQDNNESIDDRAACRGHSCGRDLLNVIASDDDYAIISTNNNDDNNSIIARNARCHSEELSAYSKSLKKKKNRLPGWLVRNNAASSSSRSNRSNPSITSPSSSFSTRKRLQNQPSSSPTSRGKNDTTFQGLAAASNNEQSTTTDHIRGVMPRLCETSREIPFSSNHQSMPSPASSFIAQSPLHAPPLISSSSEGLLAAPSLPSNLLNSQSLQPNSSISAQASFVCNADKLPALSGSLIAATEYYIEDRLDDYDKYDTKEAKYYDPLLTGTVSGDSDFKVDKHDAPSIDNLLQQAGEFAKDLEVQDDDQPLTLPPPKSTLRKGKSDGESVPLSDANSGDERVHNDFLKIVLVGDNAVNKSGLSLLLRKSTKKLRKRKDLGVDVHTWTPPNTDNVKFTIWEVQASKSDDPLRPNFGARPGTQSLFFSNRSLYLLVWDMAANNSKTFRPSTDSTYYDVEDEDDSEDEDNEEYMNEYQREESNRRADRALQTDIHERVLSWVDCVARKGPHSAILPIALVPSNMSPDEAKRRCHIMQTLIMDHTERKFSVNTATPKVLCGPETVICVSLDTNMGLDYLEQMILEIADPTHNVFDHVGRPVPPGTVEVLECCRRLKSNSHKLILVDHLVAELPTGVDLSIEIIMQALQFLSDIGKLLFFGDGSNLILKHYVILNRSWLVGALSCILRNDLERELSEMRRFMNIQSLYSNQRFQESDVTKTFSVNNSSCPILSSEDTQMLWQSMTFIREAAVRSSQLSENCQSVDIFGFLEHLLVYSGVFMPLDIDTFSTTDSVYFVPSLLSQESAKDVWTYKSRDSWMTTLCHSWLFRDGAPLLLMEKVTVALLRDLYESSNTVGGGRLFGTDTTQTFPFGRSASKDYLCSHDNGEPIGPIRIHQIVCWKNSLLLKIGRKFPEGNGPREEFIEVFVAVTDQISPHSVSSDAMGSNMQRLVVSGKGQYGLYGQKLWKGGYNIVLDSIKASVADHTNVERQVVCPQCLAHERARSASTWSWDSVRAASDPFVRCMKGHKVDRNMICGTLPVTVKEDGGRSGNVHKKLVKDLLPSVLVVGLWDDETKAICQVGSGFVANRKHGLIVTAGHVLFKMQRGRDYGNFHYGMKKARAVVGLVPKENDNTAVFRYFAEIVAEDIHNIDACILKITSKLDRDVADAALIGERTENPVENFQLELESMKITNRYELEQSVRIIGFNQGGEGIVEKGKHVNRSVDVVQGGYICKQFIPPDDLDDSSSSGDSSSSEGVFAPREEIVINNCPTIAGHSGGPCVNDEGKVIGILSRVDPVDRGRCYLVPSSEIKTLINQAKKKGK